MITKSIKLFVVTIAILANTTATAESHARKIATVDINAILNGMPAAKAKREEFETKRAAAQKKLDSEKASLMERESKLKAEKVADTSLDAEKFRQAASKFESTVKDTEDDLKREFVKANREFAQKAMKSVEAYAKEHQIDLVLAKESKGRSAVLYGEPSSDITAEVLKSIKE